MRTRKPLAVRIFIRICVFFMALSLIAVYVVYMFPQPQEAGEDTGVNTWDVLDITWDVEIIDEILPEINPDEPESTEAPILITEDGEVDEMDQMVEVQLENGETELVRQWDLWDAIQINQ